MSKTPTKQIDGDVAVGRNVAAGGNANIQGHMRVGHDLKVEGWLDAKNIKGPCKGLFSTSAALTTAYPRPRPGWWALVGSTIPAQLYTVDGGQWNGKTDASGAAVKAGEIMVSLDGLRDDVDCLLESAEEQEATNNELRNWIEELDNSIGEPEGCGGLALYDGNVDGDITVSAQTYAGEASPTILFSTHHKRFVAKVIAGTAPILLTTYYANWAGADRLGAAATDGRTPETDRLYLNTANRTLHYWAGTAMAQPDGVTNEIWDTLDAMMASLKSLERTAGYSGQLNLNVYLAYKPGATRQVTQPFAGLTAAIDKVPTNMRYTGLALTFLESQAGGSPQWRTCRFVGTIPIINNAPDYTEWTNANYWTDL